MLTAIVDYLSSCMDCRPQSSHTDVTLMVKLPNFLGAVCINRKMMMSSIRCPGISCCLTVTGLDLMAHWILKWSVMSIPKP